MKKLFVLLLAIGLLAGCSGGGQGNTASQGSGGSETVRVRLGHVFQNDHPIAIATEQFAKTVKEKTEGRVNIELYPNSQLGGEVQMFEDVMKGALEMGNLSPSVFNGVDSRVQITTLPYIVGTFEEADKVYYSEDNWLTDYLKGIMSEHNIVTLSFVEQGFRAVTNSVRPIQSIDDMNGLKIRVPETPMLLELFSSLGTQPTPIAFPELYTSLQQGVVDGQDNGIGLTYSSKLYEVQKYITQTNHIYNISSFVINEGVWNNISEADQEIMMEAAKEATVQANRDSRAALEQQLEEMVQAGMESHELSEDELNRFKEVGKQVWTKFEDELGKETMEQLNQFLNEL